MTDDHIPADAIQGFIPATACHMPAPVRSDRGKNLCWLPRMHRQGALRGWSRCSPLRGCDHHHARQHHAELPALRRSPKDYRAGVVIPPWRPQAGL